MRHTHTSKQTSKCSTHIICRIFVTFSSSIFSEYFLFDAQISEYNKFLSTTLNAYDTSQENTNPKPTAPQLQNLQ